MKADVKPGWKPIRATTDRNNHSFVVRFDNPPESGLLNLDYATKWSDDCFGEIEVKPLGALAPSATPPAGVAIITTTFPRAVVR